VSILVSAGINKHAWARLTIPSVCKSFRDLYRSRDASPLHKTLWLEFEDEVVVAKWATTRRSPRREPLVRASRVISWARTHAESVRTLVLNDRNGPSLRDFNATNFDQLVAAVGPHLAQIGIEEGFEKLLRPPFWVSLRSHVVPSRKLRVLEVLNIPKGLSMSDVEPLTQLRGSLEVFSLWGSCSEYGNPSIGLGTLNLSMNKALGAAPDDVAFPPELKGMKSLRGLHLTNCGLRRVPAFVRELSSLKEFSIYENEHLQIETSLDYLIECCPRLCVVKMKKHPDDSWTQQSLTHLWAFKLKLLKKNPSAKVEF